MNKQDYVNKYLAAAQAACAGTPVFVILALAESAVESAWGESELAKKGNNLFGVKAYSDWKGDIITMHTKEYTKEGQPYYMDAPFKSYPSAIYSFTDYVKVVCGKRYQATGTTTAPDPNTQIEDIAKAGYSTSAVYAKLIETIIAELKPLIP